MTELLVWTFLLVVGLVGATVSATPTSECAYTNYRLPKHIVPKHYQLDLNVDTQKYECRGQVIINVEVNRNEDKHVPNNIIVLHTHSSIGVNRVEYTELGDELSLSRQERPKTGVRFCQYHQSELLVVTLDKDLAEHTEVELTVSFKAKIRDDNTGIYLGAHATQTGHYVGTDFKPDKARRAFPCFDEPSFKTTFDIRLTHDSAETALANTVLVSGERIFGRQISKFERTPPMSTHMVAFAIGEFDRINSKILGRDLTIRAFAPVGKSDQAQIALDAAVRAITHLEDYFGIQYQLKKLDLLSGVQLSHEVAGNWGLIYIEESSFLFDRANSSPLYKGIIAQAVIRGLAQQWFGNLVTLEWWDDLWLHEGFLGFVGGNMTNLLYPELQWEQNYLIEKRQEALRVDSRADVHPILEAGSHEHIRQFDQDLYWKSVAIIKSLHDDYVKPEKFRLAIRQFMAAYATQNAKANDFWSQLGATSELPVSRFIESWTMRAGHPLVTVRLMPNTHKGLIFKQKRDYSDPLLARDNSAGGVWIIPVTIVLSDGVNQKVMRFYFDQAERLFNLPAWFDYKTSSDLWFKVNNNSGGFYRVLYSRSIIDRLKEACEEKKLSPINRIGLLDDIQALHLNGLLEQHKLAEVLQSHQDERESSVLAQLARSYLAFRPLWKQNSRLISSVIEIFAHNYLSNDLKSYRFLDAKNPDGIVARLSILLEVNYQPLITDALQEFNEIGNKVAPVIRELIYRAVALHGSDRQVANLRSLLKFKGNNQEETKRIQVALEYVERRKELLSPIVIEMQESRAESSSKNRKRKVPGGLS